MEDGRAGRVGSLAMTREMLAVRYALGLAGEPYKSCGATEACQSCGWLVNNYYCSEPVSNRELMGTCNFGGNTFYERFPMWKPRDES